MSIREVQVQRVSVVSTQPFDQVVTRIDEQIGHMGIAKLSKWRETWTQRSKQF